MRQRATILRSGSEAISARSAVGPGKSAVALSPNGPRHDRQICEPSISYLPKGKILMFRQLMLKAGCAAVLVVAGLALALAPSAPSHAAPATTKVKFEGRKELKNVFVVVDKSVQTKVNTKVEKFLCRNVDTKAFEQSVDARADTNVDTKTEKTIK